MKPSRIAQVALGCIAMTGITAHAQPQPNTQWRQAETSFFDLIQNGYEIVAVTSIAERASGLPADTYVLQKNNSVFRCVETRSAESGTTRTAAPLRCAELVKPFVD